MSSRAMKAGVDLMIEHNVGVATTKRYELKEVSNDFFDEDEG